MLTKIAVLSSEVFFERLQSITKQIPTIEIVPYTYKAPEESRAILQTINPCDVVFFSGTLPYLYAQDLLGDLPVPFTYLKQDEATIATTLFSVVTNENANIHRLSMDVVTEDLVHNVLEDIQYNGALPFIHELDLNESVDSLTCRHEQLYQEKKVDFVITSVHAVYHALMDKGIPVSKMLDPKSSIVRSIEEAKSLSRLAKSQSAMAAVGLLELESVAVDSPTLLKQLARLIHASFQTIDEKQFAFYTTQGYIQHALEENLFLPLFEELDVPMKLAFGYGDSILEATENAKNALNYAPFHTIYILNEHKELLGPYPHEQTKLSLQTNSPQLLQIAKQTKLSPANLSKLMEFVKSRQSIQFTAHDLSEYLQVTRRTTERILKKLVDHQYAKIVGEEMTYQQGRPRALYEINFPIYF